MIVFDLSCDQGHRFECWFRSSDDFSSQNERDLVECPDCGSTQIAKAPMAPNVPAKGNQRGDTATVAKGAEKQVVGGEIPPEVQKAMHALAKAQEKVLKESRYVGDGFAEESRAMHYGEKDLEAIHGKATLKEAKELLEEGVPLAPLLAPFTPPEDLN